MCATSQARTRAAVLGPVPLPQASCLLHASVLGHVSAGCHEVMLAIRAWAEPCLLHVSYKKQATVIALGNVQRLNWIGPCPAMPCRSFLGTLAAGRPGQDTASTLLAAMAGEGEDSTLLGGAVDGHPIYVWTPEGKVSMQGDA